MGIPFIQIPKIRKNWFRILRSLKLHVGGNFSFGNFARIASLCVFFFGTLHGYYFHSDFWSNSNFPLEHQTKLVLMCLSLSIFMLLVYNGRFSNSELPLHIQNSISFSKFNLEFQSYKRSVQ